MLRMFDKAGSIRKVFNALKVLVAVGMGRVEVFDFDNATAGLDPTELLDLANLFQETAEFLAKADQAAVDRWLEDIHRSTAFQGVKEGETEYREMQFKLATRGVKDVAGRVQGIITQLQNLATTRAEEIGSLVEQVGTTRVYCNNKGNVLKVTFLGVDEGDWEGGWRVYNLKPAETRIEYVLSGREDFFIRTIGWPDDGTEMSGANGAYLFTRYCEEWIQANQAVLREKLQR